MSYDVRLSIHTGGEYPAAVTETRSPTYNLAPMFREALGRSMRSHDGGPSLAGMLAKDALPVLRAAITAMEADPDRFRSLNPPNGWGSYESALSFFREFAEECEQHPLATVEV